MRGWKPWTVQPPDGTPIDWGNPLALGLVDVIEFYGTPRSKILGTPATLVPYNGQTLDVALGAIHAPYGASFDTSPAAAQDGAGVKFIRSSDARYAPAQLTHVGVFNPIYCTSSYSRLMGSTTGTAESAGGLRLASSGSPGSHFYLSSSGYNASTEVSIPALTFGSAHVVGLSGDATGAYAYVDGAFGASLASQAPVAGTTASILALFVNISGPYTTDGYYWVHYFWRRRLSAGEHDLLANNPWQLYWKRRRFYSIIASTGSVFTASPTMQDAIVAAQAALSIAASAAPTVPVGTAQASAALAITGSVAIAVPDGIVTAALSSGAVLTAALTAQHGIPQSSASLSIVATASPTVPPVSPTASGALSIALTGSATVPAGMARANAGTGSVFSVAIVAQTGAISATGALSIAATGTITAATPSVSARGALSIAGAVETTIPDAEARAAASTASGSVLSAALRVPTASAAIQTQLVVSANIAIAVPDALVTAAGIIGSTPNPCMMVYLPARKFTVTLPARKFTVTLKC